MRLQPWDFRWSSQAGVYCVEGETPASARPELFALTLRLWQAGAFIALAGPDRPDRGA